MARTLMVMAGGTGGHVFPGIAVAQALKQQGWQIHWLGTKDRMEAELVPKHGFTIHFIDIAGVRGNGLVRLLRAPFKILHAIWQALSVMRRVKPDVVLGMGGYASGPGGIAAWLKGIPLVLHEQNAVPGMTNKLLAFLAQKVLTAFDVPNWKMSKGKKSLVGNPVRPEFGAVPQLLDAKPKLNILVTGGSLGALALNQAMPKVLSSLTKYQFAVWHQAGKGKAQQVEAAYQEAGLAPGDWRVVEFIDDMVAAYAWADIIVCRAGALTVSEVALAGRCAIFVPLPHAVDDHQTKNAQSLVAHGAAFCIAQTELQHGALQALLEELLSTPKRIVGVAAKAKQHSFAQATDDAAAVCISMANTAS